MTVERKYFEEAKRHEQEDMVSPDRRREGQVEREGIEGRQGYDPTDEKRTYNDRDRFRDRGTHSRGQDSPQYTPPTSKREGEEKLALEDLMGREAEFRRAMVDDRLMEIINMDEDGNCLFRAVSHQVYGSPDHHHVVREKCVEYLESQRSFFRHYVAEDDFNFDDYCERMKNSGIWGGEIEVQAMSEIYDRTIEIYVYQTAPTRTYHQRQLNDTERPIRLSYHFRSHYNSVRPQEFAPIIRREPGLIEDERIAESKALDLEDRSLNQVLTSSRAEFEKVYSKNFDKQMKEAMDKSIDDMFTKAVEDASCCTLIEDRELGIAIEKSTLEFETGDCNIESDIIEDVLQRSLAESLPRPVEYCHRTLNFDLENCKVAFAHVTSLYGSQLSEGMMVDLMSEFMKELQPSFSIYEQY